MVAEYGMSEKLGQVYLAGDKQPLFMGVTPREAGDYSSPGRLRGGLALMDAHDLGFRDVSFDRVLLPLIVAVAAEPRVILREGARVCRTGGLVVIFDKFRPAGSPPSLPRRILNVFSRTVATDITLDPSEVAAGLPLRLQSDEPAFLGRQFRIIVYEKIFNRS